MLHNPTALGDGPKQHALYDEPRTRSLRDPSLVSKLRPKVGTGETQEPTFRKREQTATIRAHIAARGYYGRTIDTLTHGTFKSSG